MLTAAERQEKIAQIKNLPASLQEVIRSLNEAQLDAPGGEGEWTVRQIVHHLADAQMNGFIRMKLVLTEKNPILKPNDQDAWAALRDTTHMPLQPSLLILQGLCERWAALLESVPEEGWSRTGIHLDRGKMTLDDLLTIYARHGTSHIDQIAKLRAAKGW